MGLKLPRKGKSGRNEKKNNNSKTTTTSNRSNTAAPSNTTKRSRPRRQTDQNETLSMTAESDSSQYVAAMPPATVSLTLPPNNNDDDDVSSIQFGESVSSPTYCYAQSSLATTSKKGVPSPLKFVPSDSHLYQGNSNTSERQTPSSIITRESATPPIRNTTQPLPALTCLLYLSLVTFEHVHSSCGKHIVRESLQRHAYSTVDEQQQPPLGLSRARSSVPVDVDDVQLVIDEEDSIIVGDVIAQHLRQRNIAAAIEVYQLLTDSNKQEEENDDKFYLHQQLSVLYVLQGNRRQAVKSSECAGRQLQRGECQEHVIALFNLATMLLYAQKPKDALCKFRQAFQLQTKLVGRHHALIPCMLNNIAIAHVALGELDEALVLFQESLLSLRNAHSCDLASLKNMSTTLLNLGICAWKRQDYTAATEYFEEGLLVLESLLGVEHDYVQLCRITLEQLLEERAFSTKSVSTPLKTRPVFGYPDGIPLQYASSHAIDVIIFGSLQHELTLEKRVKNAVTKSFRSGVIGLTKQKSRASFPIDLDRGTIQDAELHLQSIHNQVVKLVLQDDEIDDALELLRSTLRSHKQKYGHAHHLVGAAMHNIALVNLFDGRYEDAEWYFSEAVSVLVAALGTDHPSVAASMMKLGMIQMANGNLETADVTFTQVLETRKVIGNHRPEIASILNLIAYVQYELGNLKVAVKSMEEALEIQRDCVGCEEEAADTASNIGFLHAKRNDYGKAAPVLRDALGMQCRVLGDAHPRTLVTRENLNHVLSMQTDAVVVPVTTRVDSCFSSFSLQYDE